MNDDNNLSKIEILFLALADQTRLRILNLMRENEVCVWLFTEVLGESQPKISRHLAYLRNAGVVSARREGKWIYYKIDFPADGSMSKVLENTLEWLSLQEKLNLEYRKLSEVCRENDNFDKDHKISAEDVFVNPHTTSKKREELEIFLL